MKRKKLKIKKLHTTYVSRSFILEYFIHLQEILNQRRNIHEHNDAVNYRTYTGIHIYMSKNSTIIIAKSF